MEEFKTANLTFGPNLSATSSEIRARWVSIVGSAKGINKILSSIEFSNGVTRSSGRFTGVSLKKLSEDEISKNRETLNQAAAVVASPVNIELIETIKSLSSHIHEVGGTCGRLTNSMNGCTSQIGSMSTHVMNIQRGEARYIEATNRMADIMERLLASNLDLIASNKENKDINTSILETNVKLVERVTYLETAITHLKATAHAVNPEENAVSVLSDKKELDVVDDKSALADDKSQNIDSDKSALTKVSIELVYDPPCKVELVTPPRVIPVIGTDEIGNIENEAIAFNEGKTEKRKPVYVKDLRTSIEDGAVKDPSYRHRNDEVGSSDFLIEVDAFDTTGLKVVSNTDLFTSYVSLNEDYLYHVYKNCKYVIEEINLHKLSLQFDLVY